MSEHLICFRTNAGCSGIRFSPAPGRHALWRSAQGFAVGNGTGARKVQRLSHVFLLSWSWRRWGLAFLAGAISALSLAPLGWFFVLALTLPALVWLLDGAIDVEGVGGRRFFPALSVGWWFGFGYHLAGLWWIGRAFLVDADAYAWLLPVAVLAMPAGLALFSALGTGIAALLWRDGWPRILALAVGLAATDYLRGTLFTGFPWNGFAQAFADTPLMSQMVSVIGSYGLGFLVVLIFASPAVLADGVRRGRPFFAFSVLLLSGIAGFGAARLGGAVALEEPGVALRLVQPSIPQEDKWLLENRASVFATYVEMSGRPFPENLADAAKRVVIWPESAVPFLLTQEPGALATIASILQPGEVLLTGAIRSETDGVERTFYNSIYAIAEDGTIIDAYDKVHLVPFGEFLPLEGMFEALGIRQLVEGPGRFKPGFRHRLLSLDGIPPLLPLVCYEIIFPDAAVNADGRPEWILNLTNDAWFGVTSGPYQHLAQARMRAVEQGVPVVRVANTGISAVIDPLGRTQQSLALGVRGMIDTTLPQPLPPTIYARYGSLSFFAMLAFGLLVLLIARRVRHHRDD